MVLGLLNKAAVPTPSSEDGVPPRVKEPPPATKVCAPPLMGCACTLFKEPPTTTSTPEALSANPTGPEGAHALPTLDTLQIHAPLGSDPLTLPAAQAPGQTQDAGPAAPPAHVCPAGQLAPLGAVEPGVHA